MNNRAVIRFQNLQNEMTLLLQSHEELEIENQQLRKRLQQKNEDLLQRMMKALPISSTDSFLKGLLNENLHFENVGDIAISQNVNEQFHVSFNSIFRKEIRQLRSMILIKSEKLLIASNKIAQLNDFIKEQDNLLTQLKSLLQDKHEQLLFYQRKASNCEQQQDLIFHKIDNQLKDFNQRNQKNKPNVNHNFFHQQEGYQEPQCNLASLQKTKQLKQISVKNFHKQQSFQEMENIKQLENDNSSQIFYDQLQNSKSPLQSSIFQDLKFKGTLKMNQVNSQKFDSNKSEQILTLSDSRTIKSSINEEISKTNKSFTWIYDSSQTALSDLDLINIKQKVSQNQCFHKCPAIKNIENLPHIPIEKPQNMRKSNSNCEIYPLKKTHTSFDLENQQDDTKSFFCQQRVNMIPPHSKSQKQLALLTSTYEQIPRQNFHHLSVSLSQQSQTENTPFKSEGSNNNMNRRSRAERKNGSLMLNSKNQQSSSSFNTFNPQI